MATFSDNFDGGSGNLDARTNWADSLYTVTNASVSANVTLASDAVRRTGNSDVDSYTICDGITPGTADYLASVKVRIVAETTATTRYIFTPAVRCVRGAAGMTGYAVRLDTQPDNLFAIFKKYLNGVESNLGTALGISDYDWTSFQTVKITVSGTSTVTITLYINDVSIGSRTDSSSPITDAGKAALMTMYQGTGTDPDSYYDDFFVDDGLGGEPTPLTFTGTSNLNA